MPMVIVKEIDSCESTYSLLIGITTLVNYKTFGRKTVKAVVIPKNAEEINNRQDLLFALYKDKLILESGLNLIGLDKIFIPTHFANSKSSIANDKILRKSKEFYANGHKQIHPIIVDEDGFIVDGYIDYLILVEAGIRDAVVSVKQSDRKLNINDYPEFDYC